MQSSEHHEVACPSDEPIRIAVVSDTHSVAHPDAFTQVRHVKPDLILHAGDIGDLALLDELEAIAPTHAVRGNIDGRRAAPDVITIVVRDEGDYELRILMTHIALYGPKLRRDAKALARVHNPHLFICGHSHVPFLAQEGKVVIFNPGSIGPRRFSLPICFGLLEFGPGHSSLRHIDCETGETWLPPA